MVATRWYAVWPDTRPRFRSWRFESCENGRFQSVSPPVCMYLLKRLTVNYDIPRQNLNLIRDRFLIFFPFRRDVTFKVRLLWSRVSYIVKNPPYIGKISVVIFYSRQLLLNFVCSVSRLDESIWQYLDWKFTCESIASWNSLILVHTCQARSIGVDHR